QICQFCLCYSPFCSWQLVLEAQRFLERETERETLSTNIPCTARNRFNQMSGLNFKADGRRYVVDVYRGHKTTLIGGDDWAKFKHDFDVGQGNVVVFDMTGRTAKAYVAGVEAEEQGGAAEEVVAVDEEEEVVNDDHGLEDALAFVNTRGFVFEDGEYAMMELILTIQHLYIGPPFVHRLTPTIIAENPQEGSSTTELGHRRCSWPLHGCGRCYAGCVPHGP
uniref:TF-B3 domain-containing protein n=1 Tax=Aegilops tauschii subsp. strangulata TaxID=200361 RepID=A0A453SMZ6_AEGTS